MVLHACGGDLLGTCMQMQTCNAKYDFAMLYMYHNLVFHNDQNAVINDVPAAEHRCPSFCMKQGMGALVSLKELAW